MELDKNRLGRPVMYRYDAGTGCMVVLSAIPVIKETPHGRWLDDFGRKRFVLNEGRKRYAWETKELALESLRIRTARRITILAAQLKAAQEVAHYIKDRGPDEVDGLRVPVEFDL